MIRFLAISACLLATTTADELHWAYQAPASADIPPNTHPVDHLLSEQRNAAGLMAAEPASAEQWLDRAAYTLTGLPPSPEQSRRLLKTPDEATRQALTEELLASPAYGERWARHWMDVARYADTWGYNFQKDNRYPHAYTYRDWLIRSFNDDLPYDRFIKLQIAADHLVPTQEDPHLAALGFLTVGPRAGGLETNDDRVDVITRGFLSSTIACARCHDHKTDPFTQQDYYSFYSILENTVEEKPIIGKPIDEKSFADFENKKNDLLGKNHIARFKIVEKLRSAESIANSLEIAWLSKTKNWSNEKLQTEGFKRGLLRAKAIRKWREFLDHRAWGDKPSPRLSRWVQDMDQGTDRKQLCQALAREWIASLDKDNELGRLAKNQRCPLSFDVHRINAFFNQSDGNEQRDRDGALARLEASHPGAPPRAMALRDRERWSPAQVYNRGNPADRGKAFERHWPTILGGGVYGSDKSPRLAMAEKIADRSNPLTARVMVNRVWAWHFGAPLAEPGDFGPQQTAPPLHSLLDHLAVWFMDHHWSVKDLHRLLLSSEAYRLSSSSSSHNEKIDQANTLFWRWNRQRLDFESARDRLLFSSGTLQREKLGGPSVDLSSPSSNHRRSLYAFLDRYALPGLFVNFDVPHPDHHAPRRAQTTVPQQALYYLNNSLPISEAAKLIGSPPFQQLPDNTAKVRWLYERVYHRPPRETELREALDWIKTANPEEYGAPLGGFWQVRYRANTEQAPLTPFPLFHEGAWRTGKELSSAPVKYLYASPKSGHAAASHALVLRWQAQGRGTVRMEGSVRRTQQGGATLVIDLTRPDGSVAQSIELPPESERSISGPEITVAAGANYDFVLRAPNDSSFAGVEWDLVIMGRESPSSAERELSNIRRDFPSNNKIPPPPKPSSPWIDLLQALWASNEFHFID